VARSRDELTSNAIWQGSLARSRSRRAAAATLRRKRFRRRGSVWSLALVLVLLVTLGASLAVSAPLRKGMRGSRIALVQKKLGIPADGVFGSQTKKAVKRFQRRHHLTVDGLVGRQTLRAMHLSGKIRLSNKRAKGKGGHGGHGGGGHVHLPAILKRIAQCESGGNPRAVSRDGRYRGKYQFTMGTWHGVGGRGDPIRNSEREQDKRALILYHRRGTSPWPVCSKR
jgi:resuscitation-promoting factor RpfB